MTTGDERMAGVRATRPAKRGAGRRPYHAPEVHRYGSLRGLTLGGSIGQSDSGMNNMEPFFFSEGYYDLP